MSKREAEAALDRARSGDGEALFELLYEQLCEEAHWAKVRASMSMDSLGTKSIVHETYERLFGRSDFKPEDERHLLIVAANVIRNVIVDKIRSRKAMKRPVIAANVSIEDGQLATEMKPEEIEALDEALEQLAKFAPRAAHVVGCRIFAGYTIQETADILEISPATVKREFQAAAAWLFRFMSQSD